MNPRRFGQPHRPVAEERSRTELTRSTGTVASWFLQRGKFAVTMAQPPSGVKGPHAPHSCRMEPCSRLALGGKPEGGLARRSAESVDRSVEAGGMSMHRRSFVRLLAAATYARTTL